MSFRPYMRVCDNTRLTVFPMVAQLGRRLAGSPSFVEGATPWWTVEDAGWRLGMSPQQPGYLSDRAVCEALGESVPPAFQANQPTDVWRDRLRFGPSSERLLWLIHQRVRDIGRSSVRLADRELGRALWGGTRETWPKHWRRDVQCLLESLTWLHAAPATSENVGLHCGAALIAWTADLRGRPQDDCCEDDCPELGAGTHHHSLVTIGPAFLGTLETCADTPMENGLREYRFHDRRRLRRLARQNQLAAVFLPAKIGEPACTRQWTRSQHRLLQATIREITRPPGRGDDNAHDFLVTNGQVPDYSGQPAWCPLLNQSRRYLAFNGNGYRRGCGYRLSSPGGWCAKAGYPPDNPAALVRDWQYLGAELGELVVIGVLRGQCGAVEPDWIGADELLRLSSSLAGRQMLARCHVRVYAPEGGPDQWAERLGYSLPSSTPASGQLVALELARAGVSQRDLAQHLQIDASLVSRYLSGKRRWPPNMESAARSYLGLRAVAQP